MKSFTLTTGLLLCAAVNAESAPVSPVPQLQSELAGFVQQQSAAISAETQQRASRIVIAVASPAANDVSLAVDDAGYAGPAALSRALLLADIAWSAGY